MWRGICGYNIWSTKYIFVAISAISARISVPPSRVSCGCWVAPYISAAASTDADYVHAGASAEYWVDVRHPTAERQSLWTRQYHVYWLNDAGHFVTENYNTQIYYMYNQKTIYY